MLPGKPVILVVMSKNLTKRTEWRTLYANKI